MPNYKGNGRLDGVFTRSLTLSDTAHPTLALQYCKFPIAGEMQTVQRTRGTIAIEPTGSTDSKLKITLKVYRKDFTGSALSALTWAISAGSAKVAWSSTTASGTASASTLKEVQDLINELPDFKAWVLHAPFAMSVNSDDFIALAETDVQPGGGAAGYTQVLYRDVSAFAVGNKEVAYLRLGLPELRDRNALELFDIAGTVTGHTNGTLKVYRDDESDYGNTVAPYISKTLAAASNGYLDKDKLNAFCLQGPLIIEAAADDLTACDLSIAFRQASIG
jgi:hypothetical protein